MKKGAAKQANEKRRRETKRRQIIDAYGGTCTECGEGRPHCLTIEHVGGLLPHYKWKTGSRKTGEGLYNLIISEGFPDYITVLCFNCNCGGAIELRTSA